MGLRCGIAFAVLAFAALTGQAAAGTVSEQDRDGGRALIYEAAPGEANELSIMLQSGRFTIQDGAIVIDASDGDDYVGIGGMATTDYPSVVHGGPGNDTLYGNPKRDDQLFGDDGNDSINAVDGLADRISCGPGDDTVKADPIDSVAADCEHVDTSGGEAQPLPEPQPEPQLPPPPQRPAAPTLVRAGLPALVSCPATCHARSELLLVGARAGRRVIGTGRASLSAAGTLTLRTRLHAGATRRLSRLIWPRLMLRITVSTADSSVTFVRRATSRAPASARWATS